MPTADIAQTISSIGFPIFACLCLGFYVKYLTDMFRKEIEAIRKDHAEETAKMSEAINNNTLVMQKFLDSCDK